MEAPGFDRKHHRPKPNIAQDDRFRKQRDDEERAESKCRAHR